MSGYAAAPIIAEIFVDDGESVVILQPLRPFCKRVVGTPCSQVYQAGQLDCHALCAAAEQAGGP